MAPRESEAPWAVLGLLRGAWYPITSSLVPSVLAWCHFWPWPWTVGCDFHL